MSKPIQRSLSAWLFWLASCGLVLGQIKVETSFEPSTITQANHSTYKVVINGSQQSPSGAVPSVDGLRFSPQPRTLKSASFINGVPSIRFELSFTVSPERQGSFIVPPWNMKVGNQSYTAPASKLEVLPPNQQDKIKQAQERQQQADLRQAAFLEFSSPRSFLFEGETVQASVSLFLWERLPVTRIEQVPSKNGSGFSMTELGQPSEQRNVRKNNKTYSVYTWNFGLTGALPGRHNLSFDSIIRIRVRNNRNSTFSNPFFNDPFFGFGREEGLNVSSNSTPFEVRALPLANRPSTFQGAIGSLSILSSIDRDRVSVGDPVRLTCKISGTGNLAAIPAPSPSLGEEFKVGPPAFSFEGEMNTKHSGSQTFEFIITPLQAGLLEIPPIAFSFFQPEEERYYTLATDAHSLRVDPGEKWLAPPSTAKGTTTQSVRMSTQGLFQTESEPGEWNVKLAIADPFHSRTFWLSQLILTGILSGVIFLRIKRLNPKEEARRQREKHLETKTREALKHKDVSGFHQALRRRIRLRVGIACKHPNASALSSSEIINILNHKGYPSNLVNGIIELLKICDELEYAGSSSDVYSIEETYQKSQAILSKIK